MIILDLDNTISNDGWRLPLIKWQEKCKTKRFMTYHLGCKYDAPGNEHLWQTNDSDIVIFTARPKYCSALTVRWLKQHGLHDRVQAVYFRPNDSTLPSPALKMFFLQSLLMAHGMQPNDIACAYDDRADVVEMYKLAGVRAEQVQIHNISVLETTKGLS